MKIGSVREPHSLGYIMGHCHAWRELGELAALVIVIGFLLVAILKLTKAR